MRVMEALSVGELLPRSLSMECFPSSEPVGDEARWKYGEVACCGPVPGDIWPGSRGWRISLQEVANCLARCEDRTHEGDMVSTVV